jgi:hypothetical protein
VNRLDPVVEREAYLARLAHSEELEPVTVTQLSDLVDVTWIEWSRSLQGSWVGAHGAPKGMTALLRPSASQLHGPMWALVLARVWAWFLQERQTHLGPPANGLFADQREAAIASRSMRGVRELALGLAGAHHLVSSALAEGHRHQAVRGVKSFVDRWPEALGRLGEVREAGARAPSRVWVAPRLVRACEVAAVLATAGAASPEGGYYVVRAEVDRSRQLAREADKERT